MYQTRCAERMRSRCDCVAPWMPRRTSGAAAGSGSGVAGAPDGDDSDDDGDGDLSDDDDDSKLRRAEFTLLGLAAA